MRGTFLVLSTTTSAGRLTAQGIAFPVALSAAPTAHYIPDVGPVPAGCSGTAQAPNAQPGHLCIFEGAQTNVGSRFTTNSVGSLGRPVGSDSRDRLGRHRLHVLGRQLGSSPAALAGPSATTKSSGGGVNRLAP